MLASSNAVLLAQHHRSDRLGRNARKVELINSRQSPLPIKSWRLYLADKPLNLKATLDKFEAYETADFVIIATPPTTIPRLTTSIPARSRR